MKITKFLTFATALGVLFTSCSRDEVDGLIPTPDYTGEGFLTVALADDSGVFTKAVTQGADEAGTEAERNIEGVEFYVFNSNGSLNTYYTPASVATSYSFTINAGAGLTVVSAINMELGDNFSTLSALRSELYGQSIEDRIQHNANNTLPMTGEYPGLTVEGGTIGSAVVPVSRLYARFNAPTLSENLQVNITVQEDVDSLKVLLGDKDVLGPLGFELTGHIVINGLKDSYVMPNYGMTESARWDASTWLLGNDLTNYLSSSYDADGNLVSAYSGNSFIAADSANGNVYLYENCPVYHPSVEGSIPGYERNSVYALIVEGNLFELSDPDTFVTRYWRINVSRTASADDIFKILRNAIYKLEIENVKTIGHGSPGDADEDDDNRIPGVDDAGMVVSVDVLPWRVFEEKTDI
ncbi:MAG: hypothetical protein LIP06_06145 [Tannerellaceae bacterium]|nr:hypothetical protein [Tannerellaceae bacterium]